MWISRKRVEEDLRERFGEDYAAARKYLKYQWYQYIGFIMLISPSFLRLIPYVRQYLWWTFTFTYIGVMILAGIVIFTLESTMSNQYNIRERLVGSLYMKRVRLVYLLIFLSLFISSLCFQAFYKSTAWEATDEFGRGVEVPTYFPFQVQESSGDASNHALLILKYMDSTHQKILDLYVFDQSAFDDKPDEVDADAITLANGQKAWLGGENSLHWYKDGLEYSLRVYDPLNKEDLLKVANSFKPVESK